MSQPVRASREPQKCECGHLVGSHYDHTDEGGTSCWVQFCACEAFTASASPSDDGAAADLYVARKRAADLQTELTQLERRVEHLLLWVATFDDVLGRVTMYGAADRVREVWRLLKEAILVANNGAATRERVGGMQRFQSHKIVEAAKIEVIYGHGELLGNGVVACSGGDWALRLDNGEQVQLAAKHAPKVGGYFVRYDDGYTSYSPAEAFETGYRPVWSTAVDRVERIAIACHEANRAYALASGEAASTVYPGWGEAPEAIRESARVGVRAALEGATPEQLHESWLATKAADGWAYGPVKDLAAKRHPCCVPYEDLPLAQRLKDGMFSAIVRALAKLEG